MKCVDQDLQEFVIIEQLLKAIHANDFEMFTLCIFFHIKEVIFIMLDKIRPVFY